ncbi:putative acyltransferase [Clostridium putrefaciens]|uniref:Putative acyltransferase n=1 Tax=Clostridium putrefaciens TaxID=99675 RepID=A0A381J7A3_9CLOT|nr:acyltransferase family protein [Clostridium putrefaciens]SUY46578.1 putative acyltransferase [Clostridium putrefaciens]
MGKVCHVNDESFFLSKTNTDQLKGVAILLVILGHMGIISYAGAYGVGIFLVLSGFGLTQSYLKSGTENFIRKRINKIIIPYMIITLIWFAIEKLRFGTSYSVKHTIKTLIGLNAQSPLDASMWYVTFLIYWYIAFYLIFSLPQRNFIKVISIFVTSYLIYKHAFLFTSATGVSLYVIEFPIGVLIGILYDKFKGYKAKHYKMILCIVCIISGLLFKYYFKYILEGGYSKSIFFCTVFTITFIGLMSYYKNLFINIFLNGFKEIGQVSYEMYLLEYVFLTKYFKIFKFINNDFLRCISFIITMIVLGKLMKALINYIKVLIDYMINLFTKRLKKFKIIKSIGFNIFKFTK